MTKTEAKKRAYSIIGNFDIVICEYIDWSDMTEEDSSMIMDYIEEICSTLRKKGEK
jgi:hypothetical protein